jgi:hypothetical protein
MLGIILHFAAGVDALTERVNRGTGLSTRDLLLAVLAGSLLALGLFIATYVRLRRKRQKEEARDFARLTSSSKSSGSGESESDDGTRRRKRRRRRAHRPRNPSLQQTGGLPPLRPEDQPPKY